VNSALRELRIQRRRVDQWQRFVRDLGHTYSQLRDITHTREVSRLMLDILQATHSAAHVLDQETRTLLAARVQIRALAKDAMRRQAAGISPKLNATVVVRQVDTAA
jgi:hypothetical protein